MNDGRKRVDFEARLADEQAVDVVNLKRLAGVLQEDAAAVQHPGAHGLLGGAVRHDAADQRTALPAHGRAWRPARCRSSRSGS